MRFAVLGLAVVAGLVIVGSAVGQRRESLGERTGPRAATDRAIPSSELIALNSENSDGNQQVVLIDPRSHVMSVYPGWRCACRIASPVPELLIGESAESVEVDEGAVFWLLAYPPQDGRQGHRSAGPERRVPDEDQSEPRTGQRHVDQ